MEFIVELVIGIVSIIISVWFFILAKRSETRSSLTLKKIDSQVDAIKEINTRWLDKSFDYFTSLKPIDLNEQLSAVTRFMSEVKNKPDKNTEEATMISMDISCFYFVERTNYFAKAFYILISRVKPDEKKLLDLAAYYINLSYETFNDLQKVIKEHGDIKTNQLFDLYQKTLNKNEVKNTKMLNDFIVETTAKLKVPFDPTKWDFEKNKPKE